VSLHFGHGIRLIQLVGDAFPHLRSAGARHPLRGQVTIKGALGGPRPVLAVGACGALPRPGNEIIAIEELDLKDVRLPAPRIVLRDLQLPRGAHWCGRGETTDLFCCGSCHSGVCLLGIHSVTKVGGPHIGESRTVCGAVEIEFGDGVVCAAPLVSLHFGHGIRLIQLVGDAFPHLRSAGARHPLRGQVTIKGALGGPRPVLAVGACGALPRPGNEIIAIEELDLKDVRLPAPRIVLRDPQLPRGAHWCGHGGSRCRGAGRKTHRCKAFGLNILQRISPDLPAEVTLEEGAEVVLSADACGNVEVFHGCQVVLLRGRSPAQELRQRVEEAFQEFRATTLPVQKRP